VYTWIINPEIGQLREKNKITMVTPFAGSYGMAMSFLATPSLQPLRDGLFEGSVEGFYILLNYLNWLRKKLISTLIDFILFLGLLPTRSPQN